MTFDQEYIFHKTNKNRYTKLRGLSKITDRFNTLTERVCLFLIALACGYLALFSVLNLPRSARYVSILFALSVVSILLVKLGKVAISSLILTTGISSLLLVYAVLIGDSSGAQLVFFPISGLPIILYFHNQKPWTLFGCIIPVLHAFGFEAIRYFDPKALHPFKEYVSPSNALFIHQVV